MSGTKISFEGSIGIGVGLVGLLGAGAIMLWPKLLAIGWVLLGGSLIGCVGLALHLWPPGRLRFMPLPDAAAYLYGKTRHTEIGRFAERGDGAQTTPDGIRQWYAWWMVGHGVRVFGRRPPSLVLEEIPAASVRGLVFKEGARALHAPYGGRPEFVDLAVLRSDLRRRRRELIDASGGSPE